MIRPNLRAFAAPLTLAFTLALAILPARAWDPLGHMLVGQIAYDRLSPAARADADAAIARFNAKENPDSPYDFSIAACWMDDIRSRTKDFNTWHYVTLPFTPDGMPPPPASEAEPNIIWGLDKVNAILRGETTDPKIDRDQAFVILLHLIGDIHQPLHTTSRNDDLGGNRVRVGNLKDPLVDLIFTKGGNLHFFWDSAYRRVFRNGDATVLFEAPLYERTKPVAGHRAAGDIVRREATALQAKYPPARFKQGQGDPLTWAKESHALGYSLGYGKLPDADPNDRRGIKLPASYVDAARACAEERIVLAGYRLANQLNQMAANPAPAPPAASPEASLPTATPVPAPASNATPPPSPTPLALPVPSTGNPAE